MTSPTSKPPKIPISVLVVMHDAQGQVLIIERADKPGFWQSVTGSLDAPDEPPLLAAQRELAEETGFALPAEAICDWAYSTAYEIYPHWRHRYPPGVTQNTEHVFSVELPSGALPQLSPREHTAYAWLPWPQAAEKCFSWSNVEAVRMLAAQRGWTQRPA